MKNNYCAKGLGILLLIVLIGILPVGLAAHAESPSYETLEVKLPYKHIYTTTDVSADSVFHYSISAKDDAPLPNEAAASGVFSCKGVNDSGIEDGNKTVFNLDGNLTFEFTEPGIYYYEVKADSETDGKKKNSSFYTLNRETLTITFYIVNVPEKNKMNLRMITVQDNEDEKLSEIVLEAKYVEPDKTTTSSTPVTSTPSSNTSSSKPNTQSSVTVTSTVSQSVSGRVFKTGDESNTLFYVILMTLSAVIMFAVSVLSYGEAEDSE